jgi:hypothetical protein
MYALEWRIDMAMLVTNIDDVRAQIMKLESAVVFDQQAWTQALIALAEYPCASADGARRMEYSKSWQSPSPTSVAVETEEVVYA